MHDVFLFKFYICKHFARMLNSRGIKFANISENKVLANNSEFTVATDKINCSHKKLVRYNGQYGGMIEPKCNLCILKYYNSSFDFKDNSEI